ncbi:hypothetical protein DV736_g5018, partial [Chaetothyriales sp. CBS 134916]
MKIDRRRSRLLLLLFAAAVAAISSEAAVVDTPPLKRHVGESHALGDGADAVAVGSRAGPVGTKHAPVDGKDGMPHDGPWVETEGERSRRKDKIKDDVVEVEVKSSTADTAGLPQSNEGVMDDKHRMKPEDGTRGIEGGVSERKKQSRLDDKEKKPEQPKEAPPLPQSEKDKIQSHGQDGATGDDAEVPDDLPAKPHDIPHPENPSSPKDDTIDRSSSPSTAKPDHEPAVISPTHSLLLSFAMILVSEIGDKTFLVACLMAMRHDRLLVFSSAYSALITMTVLSAVLGHAVPVMIPRKYTNFLAASLFLVFGVRMLLEARKMATDEGVTEEMKEVELELEEKEHAAQHRRSTLSRRRASSAVSPPTSSRSASPSRFSLSRFSALSALVDGSANLLSFFLSPAWVQTFVMTFLGEWGDRSQVATIAMAAGQDYWWVTAGALAGHAICTGMAVIGGKAIAGRVSLRTVTIGGAVAFLVFAVIYLLEALY